MEYSYWLAQLNLSLFGLIKKFKFENIHRAYNLQSSLQFIALKNSLASTTACKIILCGTPSFFTNTEIKEILKKHGQLIIIFHPDKKITENDIRIWGNITLYSPFISIYSISKWQIAKEIFSNAFTFNTLFKLYGYRLNRYNILLNNVVGYLGETQVGELVTKDVSSSFDLYFIEKINSKKKIWKVITTYSAELQYLRLLKRRLVPLTEIHFYSDYHRDSIIALNYTKALGCDYKIVIEPEFYYLDIFSALATISLPRASHYEVKMELLIVGIWNHGGRNLFFKNIEFAKFIITVAHDRLIKSKYRILYKIHPNKKHSWLFIKLLERLGVKVIPRSEKIIDLIVRADTVISWGSMSCVYAIELGKRVIYPKNKYLNFWIEYERDVYEANALVDVAECIGDVVKLAVCDLDHLGAASRRYKLRQIFGLPSLAMST